MSYSASLYWYFSVAELQTNQKIFQAINAELLLETKRVQINTAMNKTSVSEEVNVAAKTTNKCNYKSIDISTRKRYKLLPISSKE